MSANKSELSGGNVNYYIAEVPNPKRLEPYTAECEDIIEALGMTFAEGCAFKAIWRSCAARTLGKTKQGQDQNGIYDAEKVVYYGGRMVAARKRASEVQIPEIPTFKKPRINIHVKYEPCSHIYGSPACGCSVLPEIPCGKTFSDCVLRSNEHRFNGAQIV